jgi:glucose/mannose-6-phosphate isomerase
VQSPDGAKIVNLDDLDYFKQIDAQNMLGHIDDLPLQLAGAWEHALSVSLPLDAGGVRQIAVCGMGGSSISGELLAALVADTCQVPIISVQTYDLPASVCGPDTLVIAISHSGNTEETLAATRQAIDRGARLLAITTGGALARMVVEAGGAAPVYQYASQPRAALGWLYGQVLGYLSRLGLIDDMQAAVEESIDLLRRGIRGMGAENRTSRNVAKRMAGQLVGRIPVIWGAGLLAPVARRWKTQINENAKSVAYAETMPELNHNAVVGLEFPDPLLRKTAVVQLLSERYDHPRVALRHQATFELLLREAVMADQVKARGETRLAQQLNLIQFGDYVSYYLAMAYGIDPTPVENIAAIKEQLAASGIPL